MAKPVGKVTVTGVGVVTVRGFADSIRTAFLSSPSVLILLGLLTTTSLVVAMRLYLGSIFREIDLILFLILLPVGVISR